MSVRGCKRLESDIHSINQEIAAICASWKETPGNLSSDAQNDALVFPATRSLKGGGKRVRPLLSLWAFRNLTRDFEHDLPSRDSAQSNLGERTDEEAALQRATHVRFARTALRIGAATEILHCGSLIIDDIQDGSLTRRGAPTLHRQTGIPMAINVGNWMYFKAIELLSKERLQADAVSLMCRCHAGQSLDLATSSADLATRVLHYGPQDLTELYLRIARNKTAELMTFGVVSVLKASLEEGFQIEAAGLIERYSSLIEYYGLLFQKVDDLQNLSTSLSADKAQEDLSGIRNIVVIQMISMMDQNQRTNFWSKLFKKHSAKDVLSHPLYALALETTIEQVKAEIVHAENEVKQICTCTESENYFRNTIHAPLLKLVEQVQSETPVSDRPIAAKHATQQNHNIASPHSLISKTSKKLTEDALRIP